jgi:hypothetical protein
MLTLEQVPLQDVDWDRLDAMADRIVFQTREWLQYIARTQNAEPVIAAVLNGGATVGYFTGSIVRRFGVRILGSPFPGWTTPYMGFNLAPGVCRREAAAALVPFASDALRCVHLELGDRCLEPDGLERLGFEFGTFDALEIDLAHEDEVLLARMTKSKRYCVRKGERLGVRAEAATGLEFADEYFAQLRDVFAKQSLVPPYGVERVRELIRCLEPTGRLLLVRCRAPDGRSIATGIFPAYNGSAHFWGGASFRRDQNLLPNEAAFWYAMRYWRERGMTTLEAGPDRGYKHRYGGTAVQHHIVRRSRWPALATMREVARGAVAMRQRIIGRVASARHPPSGGRRHDAYAAGERAERSEEQQ